MKLSVRNALRLLAVLSLLGGGMQMAQAADVSCWASTTYQTPQTVMPTISISGTYAGNDLQVGATIYRNTIKNSSLVGVHCEDAFSLDGYMTVNSTPSGGGVSMETDGGRRYVYPTNVPGVGVAIWSGSQSFSETRSKYANFSLSNAGDLGRNLLLDISLIKTGPIASGSVVNASSFPHLTWDIATGGVNIGYAGLPIHLIDIAFTGSINFVTQTCTPQNVTVNMGPVGNSFFKGKGSTAGTWRDASIQMTGCPTFSGYYGKSNPQSSDGSGTASGGTRVANLFTLSVTPAHGLIDSARPWSQVQMLPRGSDCS